MEIGKGMQYFIFDSGGAKQICSGTRPTRDSGKPLLLSAIASFVVLLLVLPCPAQVVTNITVDGKPVVVGPGGSLPASFHN